MKKILVLSLIFVSLTISPTAPAMVQKDNKETLKKIGSFSYNLAKAFLYAGLGYYFGGVGLRNGGNLISSSMKTVGISKPARKSDEEELAKNMNSKVLAPLLGITTIFLIQLAAGKTTLDQDEVAAIQNMELPTSKAKKA